MYLKVHKTPLGEIVALCDAELIGLVLSEGKMRLDLKANASFYSGRKVGQSEAVAALKGAQNANLVGKKSVASAKKAGMNVGKPLMISGVPHLQIYGMG